MKDEKPFGLSGEFTFEIDGESFEGIESIEIEPSHEYTSDELLSLANGITSGTIEGTFEGGEELMQLFEDLSTYPMKPTLKRYFKKIRIGSIFFK